MEIISVNFEIFWIMLGWEGKLLLRGPNRLLGIIYDYLVLWESIIH